tara:strand:+ start:10684 stop:11157 length:474 start_codon:yes stop_codon:yes gene_type:complete
MHFYKTIFITLATVFSVNAHAEETLTVTHPPIPAPTYIDSGEPGESVGDIRIWQFPAKTNKGDAVTTDWIMTTTGVTTSKETQYRMTSATFDFGKGTTDQIVIQGIAEYESSKAALQNSVSTPRAIIGGTGKFTNASGWMETTHLSDGTWRHVLHLK